MAVNFRVTISNNANLHTEEGREKAYSNLKREYENKLIETGIKAEIKKRQYFESKSRKNRREKKEKLRALEKLNKSNLKSRKKPNKSNNNKYYEK